MLIEIPPLRSSAMNTDDIEVEQNGQKRKDDQQQRSDGGEGDVEMEDSEEPV